MPRKARVKDPNAIYHIMSRSISEILLFRNTDDKEYYLGLLKRYNEKFKSSLYGYCLMDNHVHLHFDGNGFDISKYMHCLNAAYVRYYNRKYNRHGSLFDGRFKSEIVDTDEYNYALTAYIHNNPKDIEGYNGKEEDYPYSSYGIYLNKRKDTDNLVNKNFIRGLFNFNNNDFAKKYFEFVSHQRDIGTLKSIVEKLEIKKENEYISGRQIIIRDHIPSKVISYIADKLMVKKDTSIITKSNTFRAFIAYTLRILCGLSYKDICKHIYNITISGCSNLCDKGQDLINRNFTYKEVFNILLTNQI